MNTDQRRLDTNKILLDTKRTQTVMLGQTCKSNRSGGWVVLPYLDTQFRIFGRGCSYMQTLIINFEKIRNRQLSNESDVKQIKHNNSNSSTVVVNLALLSNCTSTWWIFGKGSVCMCVKLQALLLCFAPLRLAMINSTWDSLNTRLPWIFSREIPDWLGDFLASGHCACVCTVASIISLFLDQCSTAWHNQKSAQPYFVMALTPIWTIESGAGCMALCTPPRA